MRGDSVPPWGEPRFPHTPSLGGNFVTQPPLTTGEDRYEVVLVVNYRVKKGGIFVYFFQ